MLWNLASPSFMSTTSMMVHPTNVENFLTSSCMRWFRSAINADRTHRTQLIWWTTCRSRVGGAWREKADSKPNKARAVNSGDPRSKTGRKMASGPVIHAAFDPSRL
ncbi:hypothetical protein DTO207G8_5266 [Paecilomyces variotii]|nr:hypothetical protein DTO169C6_8556 [Paecilomyces variotii]KAJ9240877.1 hypothetical protein DTO169E5_3794 [Paecilomyces variotii]KAJ9251586.1 hypothetical protein DTO207G8_5266 [Paecilomyces variotii]KAJ9383901.1 hypothetical protein DTO063F5_5005 [Paecilomyces variotii]